MKNFSSHLFIHLEFGVLDHGLFSGDNMKERSPGTQPRGGKFRRFCLVYNQWRGWGERGKAALEY